MQLFQGTYMARLRVTTLSVGCAHIDKQPPVSVTFVRLRPSGCAASESSAAEQEVLLRPLSSCLLSSVLLCISSHTMKTMLHIETMLLILLAKSSRGSKKQASTKSLAEQSDAVCSSSIHLNNRCKKGDCAQSVPEGVSSARNCCHRSSARAALS